MTENALVLETHSAAETEALGAALASLLPPRFLVALYGELATGKTCLVRGIAAHFGIDDVASPSFTLVNEYSGRIRLYHIDLFRVSEAEAADLGCAELFDSDAGCVIEWAERAKGLLPDMRTDVRLEHLDENSRSIAFCDRGMLPSIWKEALQKRWHTGSYE